MNPVGCPAVAILRVHSFANVSRGIDSPAIDLDAGLAAEAIGTSIETATRSALIRAGYPVTNDASQ